VNVFVDTSALVAVLDRDDANHPAAVTEWRRLLEAETLLVTSNYILVEPSALIRHLLGTTAMEALISEVVPALHVEWVGQADHNAALAALLVAGRVLSLVDCSTFEVMRRLGMRRVFTFDRHFSRYGFEALPGS